jgi:hypothetical protein
LADKKTLISLKAAFFSRAMRKLRRFSVVAALGVWIAQLEGLVDWQLASYRMNVEAELFQNLVSTSSSSSSSSGTASNLIQPSEMVLQRLRHNVSGSI